MVFWCMHHTQHYCRCRHYCVGIVRCRIIHCSRFQNRFTPYRAANKGCTHNCSRREIDANEHLFERTARGAGTARSAVAEGRNTNCRCTVVRTVFTYLQAPIRKHYRRAGRPGKRRACRARHGVALLIAAPSSPSQHAPSPVCNTGYLYFSGVARRSATCVSCHRIGSNNQRVHQPDQACLYRNFPIG